MLCNEYYTTRSYLFYVSLQALKQYHIVIICCLHKSKLYSFSRNMMNADASVQVADTALCEAQLKTITLEVISKIELELEVYDLISLVFLLYDVPDAALESLVKLQRISKDNMGSQLKLLHCWAVSAQERLTWRQQFLEALTICQLYSFIRKMGFDVQTVKELYSTSNSVHIKVKKVLYQICENMTSYTFENFKKTLISFDMNVQQYDTCELVLLQLMSQKFITLNQTNENRDGGSIYDIENLARIIDRESDLKEYAALLRNIEANINVKLESATASIEGPSKVTQNVKENSTEILDEICNMFAELGELPNELTSDRQPPINLKRNEKRMGICCIINQEVFNSEVPNQNPLEKRNGSTVDKVMLEKTMYNQNFEIITEENLDQEEMISFIKDVLVMVTEDDSAFMLCILSHGNKGCVYAANSVKVNVDYIQSLIEENQLLHGKPKVLILQACQAVDDVDDATSMAGDRRIGRKTDFMVCWATAPELIAFRHPRFGSLYIQMLCKIINSKDKKENFIDLLTLVHEEVGTICDKFGIKQTPMVDYTLRKKLLL